MVPKAVPAPVEHAPPSPRGTNPGIAPAPPTSAAIGAPTSEPRVGLSPSTREEIWTIVRAAVDQAVAPVTTKLRDTEARLDRAERELAVRPAIPPAPRAPSSDAIRETPKNLPPNPFPHDDPPAASPKPSYKPTSYGLVTAHPPGPRPTLDIDVSNVGPIDVPDFGTKRRLVGRLVIGLMLLGLAGAIVATILSHA